MLQRNGEFNVLSKIRLSSYIDKFRINILTISSEVFFGWISQDLSSDKSVLTQVITWCRLATSLYLS